MYSAQNKLYKRTATPILGVAFLFLSVNSVLAANTTVGEFLYTDAYLPDTAATCVLNVKNTDGTALVSSQSLVSTADGWYGYTFTSPTTVGYYRSEICCDTNGDHMCIDKSFDITPEASASSSSLTADDVASAVWGYSGRTLTGFNNIVADVWSYATRSLTSGANITATVSTTDLNTIKKNTSETRLLIEGLVNKPIIENSLEEIKDVDLSERISESKRVSDELSMNILLLGSNVTLTNSNWSKLTDRELLDNLTEAKNLLGNESDSSSTDSVFGRINFLRDTWGNKESDSLGEEMKAVSESISYTISGVSSYGKNKSLQKEISGTSAYLTASEKALASLNKKIDEALNISKVIDSNLADVDKVLGSWTTGSYLDIKETVDNLVKNVIAINKIPKGNLVLESSYQDITGEKKLKNKVLGLRALLFANKKVLIGGQKTAFAANWLEEGSVVIKTLITNPSSLISQEVPLKYYLPKEVKKENIIDSDAGTTIEYDTDKDQLYVTGNFTLKPNETKTIKVRVEDVWEISVSEIASLSKQAEDLLKPLEKTSFYAQGITLKSDIDVNLAKATDYIKDGITPEAKIKSYREAQFEIISAKEKIDKLKDMVSEASNSGSILGFVGGSQAIAVWGVVLAIVSAFVFMAIYMRNLMTQKVSKKVALAKVQKTNTFDKLAVFLVVATISGLLASMGVKQFVIPTVRANTKTEVLGSSTIDYKQLKIVELVSVDGVIKLYQDEGSEAVFELADTGKPAVEVERGEKRVRVVYEGNDVWVSIENVLSK